MVKKTTVLILLVALTGCGRISIHNYQAHDNAGLSEDKLSILHVTRHNYVNEIDGKGQYSPSRVSDLFPYTGARIELLPGVRTLSLKYQSSIHYSKEKSDLKFNFFPGKHYFLHSSVEYKAIEPQGFLSYVVYKIHECGTKEEQTYNTTASKDDHWLDPFAPACGK